MYIADDSNNRIRKVTVSTGIITTVAGSNRDDGFSGDNGPATAAEFDYPRGVALDASDNVYIADMDNHRIRKVTVSTGIVTTIAGAGSTSDSGDGNYSGDGGQATAAELNYPEKLALDSSGNVYIADSDNYRIRKVTVLTGIITTIAGTGLDSYSGDNGPATAAALDYPDSVALDASGSNS